MLGLFDVIWVYDRTITPQNWKMHVCLDFERGWFLRVNTRNWHKPCVPIRVSDNPFLDHDSHIQCVILEIDEYEIEEAIRTQGICGTVCDAAKGAVLAHLLADRSIRDSDKGVLRQIFA